MSDNTESPFAPPGTLLAHQLQRSLGLGSQSDLQPLLDSLARASAHEPGLQALVEGLPSLLSRVQNTYANFAHELELARNAELAQAITKKRLERSDRQLRTLIANLPGCVHRSSPSRRSETLFASDGIERITGWPARAFISGEVHLSELIEPEDLQGIFAEIDRAVESHTQYEFEYRLRHAAGHTVWAYSAGYAVYDEGGKPKYIDALILDITAEMKARLESAQSRRLLESAIDALDAGVGLYDAQDRLIIWNKTFAKYYGELAEILRPGLGYADLLGALYRSGISLPDKHLSEEDWVAYRMEYRRTAAIREVRRGDLWLRLSDRRSADGYTVSLQTDITALKQLNLSLAEARDAAQAASKAKGEFLANMSHEIRTPMNAIIGMTALTLDTPLSREQADYLGMVKTSADSLMVIINDILDFSRIEAGKLEMDVQPFSLADLLRDTLKLLGTQAYGKGLDLMYRVDAAVPDSLHGDRGRIAQVLTNLVGNAVKFTDRGEVAVEAWASTEAGDARVLLHIAVRDTGPGIAPDKQQHIFEAFAQADGSITRRFGGTGLGLAICTRLVSLMQGRIWLDSEPGRGSTFHLELPLEAESGAVPPNLAAPALAGLLALVVDDSATQRLWLGQQLERYGMKVMEAADGQSALRLIEATQQPIGLVLLDAHMPGLSGFDLVRSLRHRSGLAASTLMLLPSNSLLSEVGKCRQLGLAGYLVKPIASSDLHDALQHLPVAKARTPEAPARALLTAVPAAAATKPAPFRWLKILLVEDNAMNQVIAGLQLRKLGHEVAIAAHGEQAVTMVREEAFDVVVMDVQMPVMNGLDATRAIRALEAEGAAAHRGRVQIVAMTANALAGDRENCLAAGMDDYLSKPIGPDQLELVIRRVLAQRDAV